MVELYESLPPPRRRVEIANAGHNTFTDLCVVHRSGGMVRYAIETDLVPEGLAETLLSGCEESALRPEQAWPVIQHFTVAQLRNALGIDSQPVGLGDGVVEAFDGVTVTYVQVRRSR